MSEARVYGPRTAAHRGGAKPVEAARGGGGRRIVTQSVVLPLRARRVVGEGPRRTRDPGKPPGTSAARWTRCSRPRPWTRERTGSRAWCCATACSTGRAPTTRRTGTSAEQVRRRGCRCRARRGHVLVHPHRRRGGGDGRRASSGGPRGSTTSWTTSPRHMREWAAGLRGGRSARNARCRVPAFIARLVAGKDTIALATHQPRGVQREGEARAGVGSPRYPSWRAGVSRGARVG